jgi:predicted RNase H-like nuclease
MGIVLRMTTFLGIDLGWYGKPTGLASIRLEGATLRLKSITRIQSAAEILEWVRAEVEGADAVAAVDAPLVIPNATGIRSAERELNRDFRRFHAGCHAANLGRPFAPNVLEFSRRLHELGFRHGSGVEARQPGRFQIEVHPHAATIRLFGLPRIVKYKRGLRESRAAELRRLRRLMETQLPLLEPAFSPRLPAVPRTGDLKPVEDQIDAVLCGYIAAHWWYWGCERNVVYGNEAQGYVVVPQPSTIP